MDITSISGAAQAAGVSPDFANAIQFYAGKGIDLGTVGNEALDIIKEGVSDAEKLEKIGEAVALGTAIGAAIPLLGEIGVGEALGAVIAGLYSTFDNFGPQIMKMINPPDFSESQYDQMRKKAIAIGAIPNPGHAPDNEDGAIFPDGTTTGGDYPRHPPPGQKSIRGDQPYTPQSPDPKEAQDAAYFAADAVARTAKLGKLASYIQGLKAIDVAVAAANAQMRKVGSTAKQRKRLIDGIAESFRQLWLATDTTGNPPDVLGFRNGDHGLESRVAQPHVVTQAELLASIKSIRHIPAMLTPMKMLVMTPTAQKTVMTALADATTAAHAVVTAAKSGDQDAANAIADVAAKAAAGDTTAIHTMAILTVADAEQWVNRMIDRFVFGKAS